MMKFAKTDPHLNGVDSGVGRRESGVGNVHITRFNSPGILFAQEVHAEGACRREVHIRCAGWDIFVGEQSPTIQLKIWDDSPASGEIPFQSERAKASSICGITLLPKHKHRRGVQNIFKSAFEKSWAMRACEYPTVTQPGVPGRGV